MVKTHNIIATGITGVIKRFNPNRGFGFITADHDGTDAFIHIRDIDTNPVDYPDEGDRLLYDLQKVEKGVQAVNACYLERA